ALGEWHLAQVLATKGAIVKVVRFPPGEGGAKVGLDDYLVAHGPDAFNQCLEAAQPSTRPEDPRPEIVLGPLEHLSIDQGIEALARCDRYLSQRAQQLVRVVEPEQPPETRLLRGSGGPLIEAVPSACLRTRLTRHARVIEISKDKDGNTDCSRR